MHDFGIYIHWPFCIKKCPYCDFNSHVKKRKRGKLYGLSVGEYGCAHGKID